MAMLHGFRRVWQLRGAGERDPNLLGIQVVLRGNWSSLLLQGPAFPQASCTAYLGTRKSIRDEYASVVVRGSVSSYEVRWKAAKDET